MKEKLSRREERIIEGVKRHPEDLPIGITFYVLRYVVAVK
jgi:hypothetical protein